MRLLRSVSYALCLATGIEAKHDLKNARVLVDQALAALGGEDALNRVQGITYRSFEYVDYSVLSVLLETSHLLELIAVEA